jgi:hypothetical protein
LASASDGRPVAAVAAGILLFIAGLVVAVWTLEQWRSDQDRLSVAARAQGTVTGQLNGRPIVSFSLAGGDRVTFTARNAARDAYPDGTKVDVLYRIGNPGDAVIDRPRARLTRTALLAALSLGVMAFGAYLSWYARHYDALRQA